MRGEGKSLGGSGRFYLPYLTCLEGSGRFNLMDFCAWEALGGSFCRVLRVWRAECLTELRVRVGPLKKDHTRAGGGEESGRLWEAQSVVFYVFGKLWEAHLYVFFTLRAGPPTQFTFIRASLWEG